MKRVILALSAKLITDQAFIQLKYWMKFKRLPNLESPQLFTEKLQWLKLNFRSPLLATTADKYEAKRYVTGVIGPGHVIPVRFVTDMVTEIVPGNMPEGSFIIKTTHDSGGSIVVNSRGDADYRTIQSHLRRKMRRNFYLTNREWEYKGITPRIIVETLHSDSYGNRLLNDFKFHCFNGRPLFVQTIFDRSELVKENWFDASWNPQNMWYFTSNRAVVAKPRMLEEMIEISAALSEPFPYVRVDLYETYDRVLFGELTHRPWGGFMKWRPPVWDAELGALLRLPPAGEMRG